MNSNDFSHCAERQEKAEVQSGAFDPNRYLKEEVNFWGWRRKRKLRVGGWYGIKMFLRENMVIIRVYDVSDIHGCVYYMKKR